MDVDVDTVDAVATAAQLGIPPALLWLAWTLRSSLGRVCEHARAIRITVRHVVVPADEDDGDDDTSVVRRLVREELARLQRQGPGGG